MPGCVGCCAVALTPSRSWTFGETVEVLVRPAGIETDENVFDIQVGVCIVTAVATGAVRDPQTEARIRYANVGSTAHSQQETKWRCWMATILQRSPLPRSERSNLEDFMPLAFEGLDWPALSEVFRFRSSGIETKRDDFVYGFSPEMLLERWRNFASDPSGPGAEAFNETSVASIASALATPLTRSEIDLICYRPLDRRFLIGPAA